MIEIRNVSKSYKTKNGKASQTALDGVSAVFEPGEVSVVEGPDGSGKTTLLDVVSGLEKPDAGQVVLDGRESKLKILGVSTALRAKDVSFVSPSPALIEHMNVLDNVKCALAFKRLPGASSAKRAAAALKDVGLAGFEKEKVESLTIAQRQLVCIARALVKEPKVLLADEPCACLGSEHAKDVLRILKKAAADRIVVVTTHDAHVADFLGGARFEMKDGKLASKAQPGASASAGAAAGAGKEAQKQAAASGGKGGASPKPGQPDARKAGQRDSGKPGAEDGYASSLGVLKGAGLALSNMGKHKFRTVFTILATSVGIIGICTVLALSGGLSAYVGHVEETTLSSTPITIGRYKDQSSATQSSTEQAQASAAETKDRESKRAQYLKEASENRRIALNNTIASLLSSNGNQNTDGATLLNDVPSLKSYLDSNPDDIQSAAASIEYTYDTSPVIYSTANDAVSEVYPGGMFGSTGTGSSSTKGSKASMTSSAYSIQNYLSDFKVFPENPQTYSDDQSLAGGKWAENSDECMLVLNSDGTMDDTLAYTLGLKNFKAEIEPLMEKYKNGEKVEYPGIYDSYAYDDVIGTTFKVLTPASVYQRQDDGTWADMSTDSDYMKTLVNRDGRDLKIVGVVIPADGSKASAVLNSGIYYMPSLNTETMARAAASDIVKQQLADPDTDVLSGKTFAWLKEAAKVTERVDFSNLVNFDADALAGCVTVHPEALGLDEKVEEVQEEVQLTDEQVEQMVAELLNDKEFQQFLQDLASSPTFEKDVETALASAGAAYAEYCADEILEDRIPQSSQLWFSEKGDGYAWTLLAQSVLPESLDEDVSNFVAKYAQKVSDYIVETLEAEINNLVADIQKELSAEEADDGPALIEFDEQKFSKSLKINITEKDISQLGHYLIGDTSHTYASNLADFGYTTTDTPITCTIYPKTFSDKEKIKAVLDKYNNEKRLADSESQAISYSDTAGSIADVVDKAVKGISAVLVAILAFSLVSIVILIAVICAVSTFQRAREVGVLRMLGATRRDIFALFDSEAMLLGFLSGLFSVAVSALVCYAVNSAVRAGSVAFDIAQLTPQIVVGALVASAVVAGLAGILPSLFAARRTR